MQIFGFNLTDRQNQTIAAAFCAGTFVSKLLFDRIVKPVVPNYEFSFLKSRTTVSLGLAAYTTLKIMELAKLIPSVPLPFKVIGGASLFAWLTSLGFACREAFQPEENPLEIFRHNCSALRGENGKDPRPFHYAIELKNSGQSPSPIVHVIYNPCRGNEMHLCLKNEGRKVLKETNYALICSADISSYRDEINKIKKAAFGSLVPESFSQFSCNDLTGLSVLIVRKSRSEPEITAKIQRRHFYLPIAPKKLTVSSQAPDTFEDRIERLREFCQSKAEAQEPFHCIFTVNGSKPAENLHVRILHCPKDKWIKFSTESPVEGNDKCEKEERIRGPAVVVMARTTSFSSEEVDSIEDAVFVDDEETKLIYYTYIAQRITTDVYIADDSENGHPDWTHFPGIEL